MKSSIFRREWNVTEESASGGVKFMRRVRKMNKLTKVFWDPSEM